MKELKKARDRINTTITIRSGAMKELVEYVIQRQKDDVLVSGFYPRQNPYHRRSGDFSCLFLCAMLCVACGTCCGLIKC